MVKIQYKRKTLVQIGHTCPREGHTAQPSIQVTDLPHEPTASLGGSCLVGNPNPCLFISGHLTMQLLRLARMPPPERTDNSFKSVPPGFRMASPRVLPEHTCPKESPEGDSKVFWLQGTIILKADPSLWCNLVLKKHLHIIPEQWNFYGVWQKQQDIIQPPCFQIGAGCWSRPCKESQQPRCLAARHARSSPHLFYRNIPDACGKDAWSKNDT